MLVTHYQMDQVSYKVIQNHGSRRVFVYIYLVFECYLKSWLDKDQTGFLPPSVSFASLLF